MTPQAIPGCVLTHPEIVYHIATVETEHSGRGLFPYAVEYARPELMQLRLVSRNFCAAASRHLFKHIVAPTRNPLLRLVEISRSEYAAHVRHLETGYARSTDYRSPSRGQDIKDLAGVLLPCLARLSDIRVLKFRASCPSFTREQEGIAIKTIVAALRCVTLPRLEGLELHFPVAYDFGYFFPNHSTPLHIPMEDILHRLKYLALHVTAFTKELGQRHLRSPVLPAHAALPNDLHAVNLLRLAELAPYLEALRISSTDVLPFHPIHFSPALRLASLCLQRVLIRFNHFSALISQCKDHLKHIDLSLVELDSGTCHAALTQLCQLPGLVDILISSCGYPTTGPNAHLVGILSAPDDPVPLETMNSPDYDGLDELRESVNANRVALGLDPLKRWS